MSATTTAWGSSPATICLRVINVNNFHISLGGFLLFFKEKFLKFVHTKI